MPKLASLFSITATSHNTTLTGITVATNAKRNLLLASSTSQAAILATHSSSIRAGTTINLLPATGT
jgi:hypothetical protein